MAVVGCRINDSAMIADAAAKRGEERTNSVAASSAGLRDWTTPFRPATPPKTRLPGTDCSQTTAPRSRILGVE
jgi:hypothetical protein